MALVKSITAGAAASLLAANVAHQEGSGDGGALGIVDVTIAGHRLSWSWTIFLIATVLVWVLLKTVNYASPR